MPPCSSRALTVWLTGLPSAGKSTIGSVLIRALRKQSISAQLLDGDVIRSSFPQKLGFSRADREVNLRRIASMADELTSNGVVAIVASICPFRDLRDEFRTQLSPFLEVFVNAPLTVCEERDIKGLYRRYRAGEVKGLTGMDDVYEPPLRPDVECRTDLETIEESANKILSAISQCFSVSS
jgi:adenylylsulfate kinase